MYLCRVEEGQRSCYRLLWAADYKCVVEIRFDFFYTIKLSGIGMLPEWICKKPGKYFSS